jgi:hypothetical protein
VPAVVNGCLVVHPRLSYAWGNIGFNLLFLLCIHALHTCQVVGICDNAGDVDHWDSVYKANTQMYDWYHEYHTYRADLLCHMTGCGFATLIADPQTPPISSSAAASEPVVSIVAASDHAAAAATAVALPNVSTSRSVGEDDPLATNGSGWLTNVTQTNSQHAALLPTALAALTPEVRAHACMFECMRVHAPV